MDRSSSSNESFNTEYQQRMKKRIRKKLHKNQDGSYFENLDKNKDEKDSEDRDYFNENKTSGAYHSKKKGDNQSISKVSDSNNGYMSEELSSNQTPRRKLVIKDDSEQEEENKLEPSNKSNKKKIKLRVKKIDEEGVSLLSKYILCAILHYT